MKNMLVRAIVGITLGGAVACASNTGADHGDDTLGVAALAVTAPSEITSAVVDVSPAGTTAELSVELDAFRGLITVPSGQQTFHVEAYVGNDLVGEGSAEVAVQPGTTVAVAIQVLDLTGAPPALGEFGPLILSATASNSGPTVGETVDLMADAVQVNGDQIDYLWESSCAGTFADSSASSTTWVPSEAGTCTLSVAATSNELTDTATLDLVVYGAAGGAVELEATFVPHPQLGAFIIMPSDSDFTLFCSFGASSTDAMCGVPVPNQTHAVRFSCLYSSQSAMSDSCGGTFEAPTYGSAWLWTPSSAGGLCVLTVTCSNDEGLESSQSFGVYVEPGE